MQAYVEICLSLFTVSEDEQSRARTGALVGGAMMTRRGVGRGRPVLGAMVIAHSGKMMDLELS